MATVLVIQGTRRNDDLRASRSEPSTVLGLKGDDTLSSNASSQRHRLDGGPGNDTLLANANARRVIGGPGNDTIAAALSSDQIISGGSGNDVIFTVFSSDAAPVNGWRILGGSGNDTITYNSLPTARRSRIHGGKGDDVITINNPRLHDNTRFYGGRGDDTFLFSAVPRAPRTRVFGGPGTDTLKVRTTDPFKLKGDSSRATLTFSAYSLNGKSYEQSIRMANISVLQIGSEQILL